MIVIFNLLGIIYLYIVVNIYFFFLFCLDYFAFVIFVSWLPSCIHWWRWEWWFFSRRFEIYIVFMNLFAINVVPSNIFTLFDCYKHDGTWSSYIAINWTQTRTQLFDQHRICQKQSSYTYGEWIKLLMLTLKKLVDIYQQEWMSFYNNIYPQI